MNPTLREKIEEEIKSCDTRIAILKHRLATREQRLQYLQDRIEKLKSGEWNGKTLLKDVKNMTKEQKSKADTIRLYTELIEKLRSKDVELYQYMSVEGVKKQLVPEFKEYHNSCPLCTAYWKASDGAADCNLCPLGNCLYNRDNHWTMMVNAVDSNNKVKLIEAMEWIIKTVEESEE